MRRWARSQGLKSGVGRLADYKKERVVIWTGDITPQAERLWSAISWLLSTMWHIDEGVAIVSRSFRKDDSWDWEGEVRSTISAWLSQRLY